MANKNNILEPYPHNLSSGVRGVYGGPGRWRALVRQGYGYVHLGYYPTIEEAAQVYMQYRLNRQGEKHSE